MAEQCDLIANLAKMLDSGIWGRHDTVDYAERIAAALGVGEDDGPEVIAAALRKALGLDVPQGDPVGTVTDLNSQAPKTITRDREHLVIPELRLDAAGARLLRTIINGELPGMAAAAGQVVTDNLAHAARCTWCQIELTAIDAMSADDGGVQCADPDECRERQDQAEAAAAAREE